MKSLHATEWLSLVYFLFFAFFSLDRQLGSTQRKKVLQIGISSILLIISAVILDETRHSPSTAVIRNLLPALIMVLAYWQSGQFYREPHERLQRKLLEIDNKIGRLFVKLESDNRWMKWMYAYFEIAYLFCYPMVPIGVAVFYLMNLEPFAQQFWIIVLPPSYACYAMVAFAHTIPPRALKQSGNRNQSQKLRSLNMLIIQRTSIQINTFPSAHAAASMAVALALVHFVPVAGWIFLWIAISIGIAAAAGRYHFAADVVLGEALALVWFLIYRLLFWS